MTRYRYEMDVTVLVDTTRGYYPEQPYEINGEVTVDGVLNHAQVQDHLVDRFLAKFCNDNPDYTRNTLLHRMDDRRWSLVAGGRVTRFDLAEVTA